MARIGRRLALPIVLLLLCLAGPATVAAHAVLLGADPADGAVLRAAPREVRLFFSEPVNAIAGGITVLSPSGHRVAVGAARAVGTELRVTVRTRERGTYLVLWRVVSADTHPARGRLVFSVGQAGPAARVGAALPLGLAIQSFGRWLHFAGYALGFGPSAFWLLVLYPLGLQDDPGVRRRLMRLTLGGVVLMLVAEPVALVGQTASLVTDGLFDPTLATDLLASPFGRVLAQRLGAVLLLWALLGIRDTRRTAVATLAVGLAIAAIDGESSHAATAQLALIGWVANTLHLAAMGVWCGGLIALLVVYSLPLLRARRGPLVTCFGRLAAASLAVLTASGMAMALLYLHRLDDLASTPYGRVLAGKSVLLLATLGLTAAGMRWRSTEHVGWWRSEGLLLAGVLALAGLLISLPPPVLT